MIRILLLSCTLALAACATPQPGCGVLGCISTPETRSRGSRMLIGAPAIPVISRMGGAPTEVVKHDGVSTAWATGSASELTVMTWTRRSETRDVGTLVCRETILVQDGVVKDYERSGACG